jgi:hypothetical protein
MTNKEDFIKSIESDSSKEEAFFAFYQDEEDLDNEHIKANSDGLKQFACFLLRIAYNIDPRKSEYPPDTFSIDQSLYLPEDSSIIKYLELRKEKKSDYKKPPEYKTTWKDKLFPIGCIGIVVLFFICAFIGIRTIFLWF